MKGKREYEVTAMMEIDRIKKMDCMKFIREVEDERTGKIKNVKQDLPLFMKYTKEIKTTKNGKERDYEDVKREKNKLKARINPDFVCPMNWLQGCLDSIKQQGLTRLKPTKDFFLQMEGDWNKRQVSKIRRIIEDYDFFIRKNYDLIDNEDGIVIILDETEKVISEVSKMKIGNIKTINRLIEVSLGIDENANGRAYKKSTKYTRKMLNILYKSNKEKFLSCFIR